MKNVDVIIPVYRGLEETKECIISAYRSLPEFANLIIINDCSPEQELTDWLQVNSDVYSYSLYENKENLGFVGTVNYGMQLNRDHDVLLLNSDVEVSCHDWLDRIRNAAYSKDKLASITPFSNNATICSFPNFCEDNDLFDGSNVDQLDLLFKKIAEPLDDILIPIPSGIGFCMYIRRDCLDEVGYFDQETFGKGYGEENDWCQRAIKAGWTNYHQLNVFAYHKGGVSFAEEGDPRKENALKLLSSMHPNYQNDVMEYIKSDPAKEARLRAIGSYIKDTPKKKILNITHALGGGVLYHLDELSHFYQNDAIFIDLKPGEKDIVSLDIRRALKSMSNLNFNLNNSYDFQLLMEVIGYLEFSHVHIHHIKGFSDQIFNLIESLKLPYDVTVHDYYFINQNPSLIGQFGTFVGDNLEQQEFDHLCSLAYRSEVPCDEWRARSQTLLSKARYVIFPSEDTQKRLCHWFKLTNTVVVQHLDSYELLNNNLIKLEPPKDNKINICVIGAISREKGADLIEKVVEKATNIRIHLIGYGYRPLKGVITYGPYDNDKDLHQKIREISPDVFWFPALWPETYSYTLSAALKYDRPIVVPDIGAFSERMEGRKGQVVPWNSDFCRFWENFSLNNIQPVTGINNEEYTSEFYNKLYLSEIISKHTDPISMDYNALLSRFNSIELGREKKRKEKIFGIIVKLTTLPIISTVIRCIPFNVKRKIKRLFTNRSIREFI